MPEFRFQIGDLVVLRTVQAAAAQARRDSSGERSLVFRDRPECHVMQIVGRVWDECSGGVQLHYNCRSASELGYVEKITVFNEIELDPFAPTP